MPSAVLYYTPKVLPAGEFKDAFERAVAATLGSDATITVIYEHNAAEGVTDETVLDAESLRQVVDLGTIKLRLTAAKKDGKYEVTRVGIGCEGDRDAFRMVAVDRESIQCWQLIRLYLGLEQRASPKDSWKKAFEEIESRVTVLEKATAAVERRLRCFVSFKFDDIQIAAQAERLKRYLSALGLEVITGEQFEPRRIEDKVKARLRADIDFVVALISKVGESRWIRDELADANARGLWVILLLENGATFDKGLFGMLEYIRYDVVIDQAFLPLLEGINFIKAEISVKASQSQ